MEEPTAGQAWRGDIVLRTSPHVVCYWSDGRFLLHHIPSASVVAARPVVARVLDFFREGRRASELLAQWPARDRASLERALGQLIAGSFLVRDGEAGSAERQMASWGAWNPTVSLFHFSTKEVPWARGRKRDALEAEFRQKAITETPAPPAVKKHPGAKRIALPRPKAEGEFARVLLSRRTWRGFGPGRLALEPFAQLLDLTFGVQFWGEAGTQDRVAFKTSPSGGARHPIEAYVQVQRVQGVARGLYHYVADDKELELLRPGATGRMLEDYLGGQWFYREAAATIFMTAVVDRQRWRYPYARAYRALLIEAGHLCQTFCLVATWLGLAPFCTIALDDARIERDLGVDGVNEIVLYAAGVGTRPTDGKWVQWPRHLAGHPYLPPKRARRSVTGRRPRPR